MTAGTLPFERFITPVFASRPAVAHLQVGNRGAAGGGLWAAFRPTIEANVEDNAHHGAEALSTAHAAEPAGDGFSGRITQRSSLRCERTGSLRLRALAQKARRNFPGSFRPAAGRRGDRRASDDRMEQ